MDAAGLHDGLAEGLEGRSRSAAGLHEQIIAVLQVSSQDGLLVIAESLYISGVPHVYCITSSSRTSMLLRCLETFALQTQVSTLTLTSKNPRE